MSPAASIPLPAATWRFEGARRTQVSRAVAVEVAVNVVYGTVPYAVMMMTPADLEDFALGFSLSEGIVTARHDVRDIAVEQAEAGLLLRVNLAAPSFHALLARRRSMAGRTSCGVCGVEDLNAVPRSPRRTGPAPMLDLEAIRRALHGLAEKQALNDATHAVHAAAWADLDGNILCLREDVGRHNAMDKLVGTLLDRGVDPNGGFPVITSRCSFEMVEKAAAFGSGALVAISAPTSMGVERAAHHGITLVAIARHDAITVFTGLDRIQAHSPLPWERAG